MLSITRLPAQTASMITEPGTLLIRQITKRLKRTIAFAVNQYLTGVMSQYNPNTIWIPNAAEPRDELNKIAPSKKVPLEMKRPILGYVGNLSGRIDVSLIDRIATSKPEWSIVLIGSTHASDSQVLRLKEFDNIYFLGPKCYPDVIDYIRQFDVAIVPHMDNPMSRNMDPLKLYLFLALGIPVVSTQCSGITRFKDYVLLAANSDEFIQHIANLMNHDEKDEEIWQKGAEEFMKEHTWDKRVSEIMLHIDAFLAKKTSGL
jgi:glycosyltransferase involved in cell wall biosynthesis